MNRNANAAVIEAVVRVQCANPQYIHRFFYNQLMAIYEPVFRRETIFQDKAGVSGFLQGQTQPNKRADRVAIRAVLRKYQRAL